MIAALFASGRIVEIALGLAACEGVALVLYHRHTRRGPAPAAVLANLAAGGCLLLALRVALAGGWWGWVALCLTGALAAHAADLRQRWPRPHDGLTHDRSRPAGRLSQS